MQHPNQHFIGRQDAREQLNTPALILNLDIMERNLSVLAEFCKQHDIAFRPHAKTHKSINIARLQVASGALGACCATIGEAETMAHAGIPGVLITSPVTTPAKLARLCALSAAGRDVMMVVDHIDNVALLSDMLGNAARPLGLLVDIDPGLHRTGAASAEQALAIAQQIDAAPNLEFRGIQCYGGHLQHIDKADQMKTGWDAQHAIMQGVVDALTAAGLKPDIISGGGTGSRHLDVDGLFNELQVGSFMVMDREYNDVWTNQGETPPFETALCVQASVVSANHEKFVTTDAGLKKFATDSGFPVLLNGAPAGSKYRFMGDEHGAVVFPEASDKLALGARVECIVPHCDPTINLYDAYHCFRGDTLIDIWPVDARGL